MAILINKNIIAIKNSSRVKSYTQYLLIPKKLADKLTSDNVIIVALDIKNDKDNEIIQRIL